jgi:nicotinamidase-related amidase
MPNSTSRPKLSEKGLLTPDNCVVAIIDLQPQMLFGVANFDRQTIINNNLALTKAARVFDVPVVLSTVETKAFSGNMWPQIQAVFPRQEPIERSSMNSWDDANFVNAIERSGRKKLILAGLWTEVCVAFPALDARLAGYEVYFVADAIGGVSGVSHESAIQRMIQAGATPITVLGLACELQRDWGRPGADRLRAIMREYFGKMRLIRKS